MPFVWVYRGRWPLHQRIQMLTEEDAERAVEEGWGQRLEGLDGRETKPFMDVPHAAADQFYATRMTGGKPSKPVKRSPADAPEPAASPPAGGLYGTREMVAAEPEPRRPGRPPKKDH